MFSCFFFEAYDRLCNELERNNWIFTTVFVYFIVIGELWWMIQYRFEQESNVYTQEVLLQLMVDPWQCFPSLPETGCTQGVASPTVTKRSILYPLIHTPGFSTIDNT